MTNLLQVTCTDQISCSNLQTSKLCIGLFLVSDFSFLLSLRLIQRIAKKHISSTISIDFRRYIEMLVFTFFVHNFGSICCVFVPSLNVNEWLPYDGHLQIILSNFDNLLLKYSYSNWLFLSKLWMFHMFYSYSFWWLMSVPFLYHLLIFKIIQKSSWHPPTC